MPQIYVLARGESARPESPFSQVKLGHGFQGATYWRNTKNPQSFLALLRFGSNEAVLRFEQEISERISQELVSETLSVPDVFPVEIKHSGGALPEELPTGALVSVSIRISEPGQSENLIEDYAIIFAELTSIDGFAGFAYGPRINLEEEIVGVAFWRTAGAYQSSLPRHHRPELSLYTKI